MSPTSVIIFPILYIIILQFQFFLGKSIILLPNSLIKISFMVMFNLEDS